MSASWRACLQVCLVGAGKGWIMNCACDKLQLNLLIILQQRMNILMITYVT